MLICGTARCRFTVKTSISVLKTITKRVAREVEGRLMPMGHLVTLDASYVGLFKQADLTTDENNCISIASPQ